MEAKCWYCKEEGINTVLSEEESDYQNDHLLPGSLLPCKKHYKEQQKDLNQFAKNLNAPIENMYYRVD